MGHPGKSAETVLSAKNLEYGEWASDVIDGLGFKKMICMGGSYGGGVLMKLMCVAPQKISKAILLVPSGICNASNASIMFTMGIPMILYKITQNKKWLMKAILPMAIDGNDIDESTFEMVKCAFDNVCIKAGMPSNVKATDMKNYTASTLLLTGEKHVLFPGAKVIARAKTIIPNLKTYLMKGSGHMCVLSSEKNKNVLHIIAEFLQE
jgi:pimeloyl-ACP methyl ester carboxylesterase